MWLKSFPAYPLAAVLIVACGSDSRPNVAPSSSSGAGASGGSDAGSSTGTTTTGAGGAGGDAGGGAGGGAASGCDPEVSHANRELVAKAIDALFVDKNLGAIDSYWAEPYLQHNPIAKSGVEPFRDVMESFVPSPSFSYKRVRTLGECDLVVVQGDYSLTGVIFDMFRVKDQRIVEHWDSDTDQGSETSGPTAVIDENLTGANRKLALDFIDAVLVKGLHSQAGNFLAPQFKEHHGAGGSGPDAFVAFVTAEDISYVKVHHVIADGNFVFALSEGQRGGTDYGFYDLLRLEGGAIVEHWDSKRIVPDSTASGLGIF